jgi:hypothetical protein
VSLIHELHGEFHASPAFGIYSGVQVRLGDTAGGAIAEGKMPADDPWVERKANELRARREEAERRDRIFLEQQSIVRADAPRLWRELKAALANKIEALTSLCKELELRGTDGGNTFEIRTKADEIALTYHQETFSIGIGAIEWQTQFLDGTTYLVSALDRRSMNPQQVAEYVLDQII